MKRTLAVILAVLISLSGIELQAEKGLWKENIFHIDLSAQIGNGPSFNSTNGSKIMQIRDSTATYDRNYTFVNGMSIFSPFVEYGLTNRLKVNIELPFVYYTLQETYSADEIYVKNTRTDQSIFKIAYYGLGAKYLLTDGQLYSYAQADFKIPQGFKNGVLDDTSGNLMRDGVFESLFGIHGGIEMDKAWIQAGITYNSKSSLMVDQLIFNLETGLTTVPNTYLKFALNYAKSLKPFNDSTKFIKVRKMPLQEEYFQIGIAFNMLLSKEVNANFSYNLVLWGKNSWNIGAYKILLGYSF